MNPPVTVRPETPEDRLAIRSLLLAAFPEPEEADLVDALRTSPAFLPGLSLVATAQDSVVGHVLLTSAAINTSSGTVPALALAPMAVLPGAQRGGVGTRLVTHALQVAGALGHCLVIVLGHPEYYPRFGFAPASRWAIRPPFDAPDDAFMALWLDTTQARRLDGVIKYAEPFEGL